MGTVLAILDKCFLPTLSSLPRCCKYRKRKIYFIFRQEAKKLCARESPNQLASFFSFLFARYELALFIFDILYVVNIKAFKCRSPLARTCKGSASKLLRSSQSNPEAKKCEVYGKKARKETLRQKAVRKGREFVSEKAISRLVEGQVK